MTERATLRNCKDCEWHKTPNCPQEQSGEGLCLPVRRLKACERELDRAAAQIRKDGEEIRRLREAFKTDQKEVIEVYKAQRDTLKAELSEAREVFKEAWDVLGILIHAHQPEFIQRARECLEKCQALKNPKREEYEANHPDANEMLDAVCKQKETEE